MHGGACSFTLEYSPRNLHQLPDSGSSLLSLLRCLESHSNHLAGALSTAGRSLAHAALSLGVPAAW